VILLDTNVISELMRASDLRSARVASWLRSLEAKVVWTTALSVAEIGVGLRKLAAGARRNSMEAAASRVFALFDGRMLAFDQSAALLYPDLVDARRRAGLHHDHVFDLQIAAIAGSRGYAVATRNVGDFAELAIEVINPWDHPAP
jgi:toxin FitB